MGTNITFLMIFAVLDLVLSLAVNLNPGPIFGFVCLLLQYIKQLF